MKLHQGKFTLDVRKKFFTGRVVCHQNRLSREVIMEANLPEFKGNLDHVLSHKS